MNSGPSIFADTDSGDAVIIRVEGKGTFTNSPCLKEFALKMLEEGRRGFVVDLKNCTSMDSTFMGTLAGISMRLEDSGGGNLWVVNINERNAELLDGLGISALFSDSPPPVTIGSAVALAGTPADKATTREVMLEAHEACIKANPENAEKFRDVLEHLAASAKRASQ
jgi:anti-sigma B factor antagonist